MPEINLHVKLNRASGVLAGIVAALAQQGLELKSQKINRDDDGKKATLDIVCEGELPDPAELAERLNAARGVEGLQRIESDGQLLMVDGAPAQPAEPEPELAPQPEQVAAGQGVISEEDEEFESALPAARKTRIDSPQTASGTANNSPEDTTKRARNGSYLRRRRRRY